MLEFIWIIFIYLMSKFISNYISNYVRLPTILYNILNISYSVYLIFYFSYLIILSKLYIITLQRNINFTSSNMIICPCLYINYKETLFYFV